MSEIKISIDDQYLQAFLAFLQTLNYVQVEKVTKNGKSGKAKPETGNATESFFSAPLGVFAKRLYARQFDENTKYSGIFNSSKTVALHHKKHDHADSNCFQPVIHKSHVFVVHIEST